MSDPSTSRPTTPPPREAESDRPPRVSIVIPAYNAERTIHRVLTALATERPRPYETIVVDDGSTDRTPAIAAEHGARLVRSDCHSAGGARNLGWREATGDVVVFLDADAIPEPGWASGLTRALAEFPGAIVGCARTFTASSPWGWVAHLQVETPYLPRGKPRTVRFLSSYCLAVPRSLELRWDESYGGEDGLFSADALSAGIPLVFDPRFQALHDHGRETFADLWRQQQRLAYGLARAGPIQREGLHKRLFSRVPLHYFFLARLVLIWRRLRHDRRLRTRFLRLLPRLAIAEWTLGLAALRYALRRPQLRGARVGRFRREVEAG